MPSSMLAADRPNGLGVIGVSLDSDGIDNTLSHLLHNRHEARDVISREGGGMNVNLALRIYQAISVGRFWLRWFVLNDLDHAVYGNGGDVVFKAPWLWSTTHESGLYRDGRLRAQCEDVSCGMYVCMYD